MSIITQLVYLHSQAPQFEITSLCCETIEITKTLFIYIYFLCWLPGSLHKYASEVKILTRTGECNKSSTDKTVSGDNENDQSGETCQGMPSTH